MTLSRPQPEDLSKLTFVALAARVQALCTDEADALLMACRAHIQTSPRPLRALRQSTHRLRLHLTRHPLCLKPLSESLTARGGIHDGALHERVGWRRGRDLNPRSPCEDT